MSAVSENMANHNVELRWEGTCVHDVGISNGSDGFEPSNEDAVCGAINVKFSLIAIGTRK
jgi:hypothetical protein